MGSESHLIISATLSILTFTAPSFPFKLNTTELGAVDVRIERVTEIISHIIWLRWFLTLINFSDIYTCQVLKFCWRTLLVSECSKIPYIVRDILSVLLFCFSLNSPTKKVPNFIVEQSGRVQTFGWILHYPYVKYWKYTCLKPDESIVINASSAS